MKVVVVGAGMAGLLACKAVEDMTGVAPSIMNPHVPRMLDWTDMAGIHVLHHNCGIDLNEMLVTNLVTLPIVDDGKPQLLAELSAWERKMANASYGGKVYGSRKASTSLMRMPSVIEGYDYVQAFNRLLTKYRTCLKVTKPVNEDGLYALAQEHDLVVCSVPRHCVVPKWVSHPFSVAYVSARPPIGFKAEPYMGQHFVVYNADPAFEWSRTARVMFRGREYWSTEYNSIPKYHVPDLRQIEKVMAGETYAMPDNVLPVGRFGKWMPGVLAHDAYWDVIEELRRRDTLASV